MQTLRGHLQGNDSWIFLAVFLVLAAERAVNYPPHSWGQYLSSFLSLTVLFLPVLAFAYRKTALRKAFAGWRYLLLWGGFMLVFPGLIIFLMQNWLLPYLPYFDNVDYFIGLAVALPCMDLLIEGNRYWQRERSLVSWFKKIGIDRAILLTMLFFSVLFSMMTVSNLESLYEHEVIQTTIKPLELIKHFFLFLTYTGQFFLIYGCLYFFYRLNDKVLIPFLLKERGVLIYAAGLAGSVALFFPLLAQILVSLPLVQKAPSLMPQGTLQVFTEQNAVVPFVVIICSLPLIVALQWFRQNQEITQLENQRIEQELNLLKQQINPHFFFNTLNNLYALSLEKSDQSPTVILQLSELMRYVIYKGKEQEVSVREEIDYLQDYIELQKIRLHKQVDLQFRADVAEPSLLIPPLLLIILVENAFKHGIEPAERECFLHIEVESSAGQLDFFCKNSFESPLPAKRGIGLENLQRRLELLFPGRHRLTTRSQNGIFTANLRLWTVSS